MGVKKENAFSSEARGEWWDVRYKMLTCMQRMISYSVSRIFQFCSRSSPSQAFHPRYLLHRTWWWEKFKKRKEKISSQWKPQAKTTSTEMLSGKTFTSHLGWSKSDVEMISAQTDALKISHNVLCNVPMHANLLRLAEHTDVTTQGSLPGLKDFPLLFFFFPWLVMRQTMESD